MKIETRFAKYYTKRSPEECWGWTGAKVSGGYGMIWSGIGKVPILAHRLALELHLGRPITEGMYVLHSCDNPGCVNPNHLREGTPQDNMDDKISRGRAAPPPLQKLTWEQVEDIRSRVGQTRTAIAKEFGMSLSNIGRILNNKRWIVEDAS